jgi:NAD(P)-dependent dehydrogenase (short-subunit alcohol dehydrogenase family)
MVEEIKSFEGDAFIDMSIHDWQLVLNVNLTSQFLCSREPLINP